MGAKVGTGNVSFRLGSTTPASLRLGATTIWEPPATDPYFADVAFLLHFDGANGSTTFTDSSGSPLSFTAGGSPDISTTQSKFGGSSLSTNGGWIYSGSGNYTDIPDLSTGDWTLEAWVWRPDGVGNATIINLSNQSGQPFGLHFWIGGDHLIRWDEGTQACATGGNVPVEQWVHVAAVRSGGTTTIYQDGLDVGSSGIAPGAGPYDAWIGAFNPGVFNSPIYIDEARVTVGVARYTSAFTPPTAPFPDQ